MKRIVDTCVPMLLPAPPDVLALARSEATGGLAHDRLAAMIPALDLLEQVPPPVAQPFGRTLKVAAWNAERCQHIDASANLLARTRADVVLLTEMDHGMARAANLHTTAELARTGAAGFVYGVEFVETGRGSAREAAINPDLENTSSFHGNAILSHHRLDAAFMLRLDDGGVWFHGPNGRSERRLGGRNAIVARLADAPFPLWVVSVHLESATLPAGRAAQTLRLLETLQMRIGDAAAIIGGDFNTGALHDAPNIAAACQDPEAYEPMFGHMRAAGFDWQSVNMPDSSQRTRQHGEPRGAHTKLDWLFVRGLPGHSPQTIAAVDLHGAAISDHELVEAEFALA